MTFCRRLFNRKVQSTQDMSKTKRDKLGWRFIFLYFFVCVLWFGSLNLGLEKSCFKYVSYAHFIVWIYSYVELLGKLQRNQFSNWNILEYLALSKNAYNLQGLIGIFSVRSKTGWLRHVLLHKTNALMWKRMNDRNTKWYILLINILSGYPVRCWISCPFFSFVW